MYKLFIKEKIDPYLFLKEVLESINIWDYEIVFNHYGKPYLKDNQVYFSISHDLDIVVIALSDKEIGVDIEALTYHESVCYKYFLDGEQEIVNNSSNKEYDFTKIWVMKESYVKMLGIGIEYGLKNVDTLSLDKMFDIKRYKNFLIGVCINNF